MPVSARPSSWETRAGKVCDAAAPKCPGCGKIILGRAMALDGYTLYTCDNPTGDVRRRCGAHSIAFPWMRVNGDTPQVSLYSLDKTEFRYLLTGSTMTRSEVTQFIGVREQAA